MRPSKFATSATLAALSSALLSACGSTTAPAAVASPTCINPTAVHRAYVVVEHLSGRSVTACVGFSGATITGKDLLAQSGIEYRTQTYSFGSAVCQMDSEPASYSQCLPAGAPYWGLWVSTAGGRYAEAATGFEAVVLHGDDALGWVYTPQNASPAPPPLPRK